MVKKIHKDPCWRISSLLGADTNTRTTYLYYLPSSSAWTLCPTRHLFLSTFAPKDSTKYASTLILWIFLVLNPHDNLVYFRAQNAVQLGPGIQPNNALSRWQMSAFIASNDLQALWSYKRWTNLAICYGTCTLYPILIYYILYLRTFNFWPL